MKLNLSRGSSPLIIVALTIVVIIVIGGGYYYFTQSPKGEMACSAEAKLCPDGSAVGRTGPNCEFAPCPNADMPKDALPPPAKETQPITFTGTVLAGSKSPLIDYNKADYDKALASDKLVVLYFYANWCPICRVEFPEAQKAFNELNDDRVVGFRINYEDSDVTPDEKVLAREFNITYQHTKVLIKNGKRILKAPETWNKDRYLSKIKENL
ncbi:MAG: thioredoxin family protein [Patescibacteria group bacterium]